MKKLIAKTTLVVLMASLYTGCAVKDNDSLEVKALKHTANSPLYLAAAVGVGAYVVVGGTAVAVKNMVTDDKKNSVETKKVPAKK